MRQVQYFALCAVKRFVLLSTGVGCYRYRSDITGAAPSLFLWQWGKVACAGPDWAAINNKPLRNSIGRRHPASRLAPKFRNGVQKATIFFNIWLEPYFLSLLRPASGISYGAPFRLLLRHRIPWSKISGGNLTTGRTSYAIAKSPADQLTADFLARSRVCQSTPEPWIADVPFSQIIARRSHLSSSSVFYVTASAFFLFMRNGRRHHIGDPLTRPSHDPAPITLWQLLFPLESRQTAKRLADRSATRTSPPLLNFCIDTAEVRFIAMLLPFPLPCDEYGQPEAVLPNTQTD